MAEETGTGTKDGWVESWKGVSGMRAVTMRRMKGGEEG